MNPDTDELLHFEHAFIDKKGPENPHIKAVGDINGDGFVDVVVASSNGGSLVWYEYPNWTRHVIIPSGWWSTDVKLSDPDGDGDLDIIISDWNGHKQIEWYENPGADGDPAAEPWKHHVIDGPRAHSIDVGDIDLDQRVEIVTREQAHEGNRIAIWKQRSTNHRAKRIINCPIGEGPRYWGCRWGWTA